MKLTGIPDTQITTPHGLIVLNRQGVATINDDQADFIDARIEAGSLPGYALADAEPAPAGDNTETGDQENPTPALPLSGEGVDDAGKAARRK